MWDSGVKFFFGNFFMLVRGHRWCPLPGLRGARRIGTSPTPSVTAYRRDISPSLSILAREGESRHRRACPCGAHRIARGDAWVRILGSKEETEGAALRP